MAKKKRRMRSARTFRTPNDLRDKCEEYFLSITDVDDKGRQIWTSPPTYAGLANYLGMTRRSLLNYEKQESKKKFHSVVKRAKAVVIQFLEEDMIESTTPTGTIFVSKNLGDESFSDKQEIDISGTLNQELKVLDSKAQEILNRNK